jgi:hypothetical protein
MRTVATAITVGIVLTPPAMAQVHDCHLDTMCEAQDCEPVDMPMVLSIDGERATLGPPGDELPLRVIPMEAEWPRAFIAEDGLDTIFVTLGENRSLVLTNHRPLSVVRYGAMTGQCGGGN